MVLEQSEGATKGLRVVKSFVVPCILKSNVLTIHMFLYLLQLLLQQNIVKISSNDNLHIF